MEQLTESSIRTSKASWLTALYKKLLIKGLEQLSNCHFTLIENNQKMHFGAADSNLHGQMEIHDARAYAMCVKGGSIGAAEAYVQGFWSTPDLTKLIQVFARCQDEFDKIEAYTSWIQSAKHWISHRTNRNSVKQAKKNILAHYDLGNELYSRFLDEEMVYSSAIYAHQSQSLEQAQLNKFDTICQRLELTEDDHLVEIGTGWGGLAIHAAQNYGCKVTTTTISEQQHDYVKARLEKLQLTDRVTLLKKDYRLLEGQYDKLVSIEMIEAVGKEYFHQFFKKCNALVKSGGKLLIQSITIADQRYESYSKNVDFIQKYIFPGGCLPSITVLSQHLTKHTDMVTESIHDIGLDYAKTLNEWHRRFELNWAEIKQHGYDEAFRRLWRFYLNYCEGAFLERRVSTIQLVARK
jgi:cyclopropane-fatty-acyl-phospholipid synthase